MTTGKLEVTIKINELPTDVQTNKDNWKIFQLDCDGRVVSVTVKPKIWKKLEDAAANYPQWVAAIGGKMGESTPDGFVLSEPNIQVFERKPKEPKPEAGQWEQFQVQGQEMELCCAELECLPVPQLSKIESEKSKPSLKILDVEILENNI